MPHIAVTTRYILIAEMSSHKRWTWQSNLQIGISCRLIASSITIIDPPTPRLFWNLRQLFVKLIAELTGFLLRLSFAPTFQIAEEFGVGFPIFVTSHKPSVG